MRTDDTNVEQYRIANGRFSSQPNSGMFGGFVLPGSALSQMKVYAATCDDWDCVVIERDDRLATEAEIAQVKNYWFETEEQVDVVQLARPAELANLRLPPRVYLWRTDTQEETPPARLWSIFD